MNDNKYLNAMLNKIRKFIWQILGVNHKHLLKSIDYVFLKEDKYSTIGIGSYENGAKVWRWSDSNLTVGKYCSIANGVNFIIDDANHAISDITSFPIFDNLFEDDENIDGKTKAVFLSENRKKCGIILGNDVWIGMGAIIMPGVKIGNGATIAAGSVVTKDIPHYCVVAGVPAQVIKEKCSQTDKEALNEIALWNWERTIIKKNILDFKALSIPEFVEKYKKLK